MEAPGKLVVILLVVALAMGSLATHFLFPQVVVEEVPQVKLTWVIQHGYHYTPAMVIEEFKLMEKYTNGRATLEVISLKGAAVSESCLSGAAQFAQRAAPGVLLNIENGAPFKIFLSYGKKLRDFWSNDPSVQSIEDIRPDTIVNVVSPNCSLDIGLGLALQRLGRPKDDYTAVYLKHPDAYQAMLSGEINCVYVGSPYTSRYASEPDRFFWLGNDETIYDMSQAGGVVYVNTEWADANPDLIAAAMAAWIEAMDWIYVNEEEAARLSADYYGYEESPEEIWEMWRDAKIVFGPTTGLSNLAELSEVLRDAGVLKEAFSTEEILLFPSLGRCLP